MALSAFENGSHRPEAAELVAVLGQTARLWEQLVAHVEAEHQPITRLWNFGGDKYGWSLRLKRRDRIVVYMTPQPGSFLVGVVLGEKAATAAHGAGLPERILALIDEAPRYSEGRGIRFTVTDEDGVAAARLLVSLKMAT